MKKKRRKHKNVDFASRHSISDGIWILSSDTICQLNKLFSNSEATMLSTKTLLWDGSDSGCVG